MRSITILFFLFFAIAVFMCEHDEENIKPAKITNKWGKAETIHIQAKHDTIFLGYQGHAYNHHPQIISFQDKLYATWSNGIYNEDEPGQVMLMATSTDMGQSWSKPKPVFDRRQGKFNDLVFTSEGIHVYQDKLIAFCGVNDYAQPYPIIQDDVFPEKNRYQKKTSIEHHTEIKISTDGGNTWSKPETILEDFIPNLRPFPISTGRLIMPGNMLFPYTDDPSVQTGWTKTGIPRLPDDYIDAPRWYQKGNKARNDTTLFCEGSFYETDAGQLVMMLRTGEQRLAATQSLDHGETWSEPQMTDYTDCRCRFQFGRLPDGRYFGLSCPEPHSVRTPLVLATSRDGVVFDTHYVLGDDPAGQPRIKGRYKYGRYGYPSFHILKDRMFVIYSINKEDIAICRLGLNELK
jgi:hypothetical protein